MNFLYIDIIFYSNIKSGSEKLTVNFFSKVNDIAAHYLQMNGYEKDTPFKVQYYDLKFRIKENTFVPFLVQDLNNSKNVLYITV